MMFDHLTNTQAWHSIQQNRQTETSWEAFIFHVTLDDVMDSQALPVIEQNNQMQPCFVILILHVMPDDLTYSIA